MKFLAATIRAYINKVKNRTTGVLHVPAQGKKKGDVLLSFITEPFTKAPWEYFSDPHTNTWVCRELAQLLSQRGYAVDVISHKNRSFIPRKQYRLCIDVEGNLERLTPLLPADCIKVWFVLISEVSYQNTQERVRLTDLKRRRGVEIQPQRTIEPTQAPAHADYLVGYGNQTTFATFAKFNKPIIPIPSPVMKEFPFPEEKDFARARTEFVWFGGGGAVLKGLDLTIEAIAAVPEFTLHIIGPAATEKDFVSIYAKELSQSNVHIYPRPHLHPDGRMTCGNYNFGDIVNRAAALIFPSASEGAGASSLQAMHAGLIPIVTRASAMPEDAPAIFVEPSVESILGAARSIAQSEPEELRNRARASWEYAREHFTKKTFADAWIRFFDSIHL